MATFITFNIYLFYGLVFFAIGCVVVFRHFKYSQLAISSTLWALALFGFSHAFHEWSELYVILFSHEINSKYQYIVEWLRLIKLSLSFAGLLIFAWLLFAIQGKLIGKIGRLATFAIVVMYSVCLGIFALGGFQGADTFSEVATYTRYLLGFGSACLAGIGMALYGNQLRQEEHHYGRYFVATGAGLIIYGVLAGLVPTELHESVPIFRTLAAAFILLTLIKALKIFELEKELATEAKLTRAIEADKYKAIGQLAMGVAHEINNPLASSTLALDLLQRKLPPEQQGLEEYIDRARLGIGRAAEISKELLAYARNDTGRNSNVYFSDVIRSALQLLSHKIAAYQVVVNCSESVSLHGQRVKLEELVINLLNNALDASEVKSRIDINVGADDETVWLEVIDNGAGMDESTLLRATELFYSTKPIGQGTGLGLAICEQIVSAHHGEMVINSAVDIGTRIHISFKR
ncbi:sensor histidine kinase [Shewanella waksmanii]|uniref:sensor histidine kinase n=1 Tax=Shewanella waksmanii TaxID=213783 RepID=UPI003736911B